MTESCYCPPEAGKTACDLRTHDFQRPHRVEDACPECGIVGKSIQRQTIKALLLVSLRQLQDEKYIFCRTHACPVVYFSADGKQTFTIEQVRERVYQKEPEAKDVFVCYCFRHTLGDFDVISSEERIAILDNINAGINAGQCACDLRNPQGSCCLGNVRNLIKRLEKQPAVSSSTDI